MICGPASAPRRAERPGPFPPVGEPPVAFGPDRRRVDRAVTHDDAVHRPGRRGGDLLLAQVVHDRLGVTGERVAVASAALLRAGAAVWTQHTRSVNNDLTLVHEQAILDVSAGVGFLHERGFASIITLGHSGGGTLYAFYLEQTGLAPGDRIATTPGGRPTKLADADLPATDGAIFLAPHPGQGKLLLGYIDPSVADETDPLSVVPELDPFSAPNGFADPPASSSYTPEFLAHYRAAQRDRVARIDAIAHDQLARTAAARAAFKSSGDAADRRRSLAPARAHRVPHRRRPPHRRPLDRPERAALRLAVRAAPGTLINYGQVGFGRLTTPEAWLSTWSGLSSHADFVRCARCHRADPFIELTGDQAAFPAESARMIDALGAHDLSTSRVRGTHFGGAIADGEPTGNELAAADITDGSRNDTNSLRRPEPGPCP